MSSPPTIGNTTPNTGRFTTLTVNDNTTLGSSNTDTVTFNGRVNSDLDPATDNAYDLGRVGHEWRDLYIDGTANIDSLIADTADINGGTIDATAIGGTTPAAGAFTTLSATTAIAVTSGGTGVTTSTGTGSVVLNTNPALTNPTVTSYTETVYALSGTAIDPANGTIQTKTLGANTTFTESLADGQSVVLMLNPVTYTVTWPTITWINTAGSGAAPTLEASSTNVVILWQVGGTVYGNWAGSA